MNNKVMNKKMIAILIGVCMVIVGIFAIKSNMSMKIMGTDNTVSVAVGESIELELDYDEDIISGKDLVFEVEDHSIATVDENGVVTGKREGETTLLITAEGYERSIRVEVIANVTGIENLCDMQIEVGETSAINMSIFVQGSEQPTIMYKSKDEKIATVSKNGSITGVSEGVTTIIISAGTRRESIKVTVVANKYDAGYAEGYEIGYSKGYDVGYDEADGDYESWDDGYEAGYDSGYAEGYNDGINGY